MAEAAVVELVVADLRDELRRDRHPVLLHLAGHPAPGRALQPTRRAAGQPEAVLPRMAWERHDERCERLEQLEPARLREACSDTDVTELPGRGAGAGEGRGRRAPG